MPEVNRIGGDWDADALEAFRAAYAQQLASPDQDEVANNTGLPTNTIANTSPWYDHVGIWKYPSGKGPEEDLKAPFDPNQYISRQEEFEEEEDDEDSDSEQMSDEELEHLVDEILGDYEEEREEGEEED